MMVLPRPTALWADRARWATAPSAKSSARRCSFIPKTVLEPTWFPQEKAEQATRCEGTHVPGAHQEVWREVGVLRKSLCPDGQHRQVKEN